MTIHLIALHHPARPVIVIYPLVLHLPIRSPDLRLESWFTGLGLGLDLRLRRRHSPPPMRLWIRRILRYLSLWFLPRFSLLALA